MNPPTPENEARRLEVLWDYEILDTPPEQEFDILTQLAALVTKTPMAMISLVDERRQWVKSRVGLDLTETDRSVSFCGHTILGRELLVVADAQQDPRFADNPLVTGAPGVRFYAGVPLVALEGVVLGTLCVMDRKPRDLRAEQMDALRLIGTVVQQRFEAVRHISRARQQTHKTATLARTVAELETEIHRRRRAEEEIRRYADIVQNLQLGLLVWRVEEEGETPNLRLVATNPAAARVTGLPTDVLVGRTFEELFPRWRDTAIPRQCLEVQRTGTPQDFGWIAYEDERVAHRDFAVRAFPLPDRSVGLAMENITDQRLVEQAQLENQARKAAILDSAPDAIVTVDHEGRIFEWNLAAERIFGYRRAAVLGKDIGRLAFVTAAGERFRQALDQHLQTGDTSFVGRRNELIGRRADGSEFPVEVTVARVPKEGAPLFTGFLRDITERRRFEEALRASQALYSSLVESLPQNVFRKDPQGYFTFANSTFCSTLGKRLEEILGRTDEDFFPAASVGTFREEERQVLEAGAPLESIHETELPRLGRRFCQFIRTPIINTSGTMVGIQGMFWDITERVQLEEHLRQAQKMETVGQLAGGVAHDFNNLLTVIQGHASMLLASGPARPEAVAALQQISTAADRASHLTRQLLTFSRKQMLQPAVLDLNELVRHLGDLLRRTLGEHVELRLQLADDLPAVLADPVMLEQVLLNLGANSRDAMPEGGQLTVSTNVLDLSEKETGQGLEAPPGRYVRLTVADSGLGIPAEHLPHIFEPFFTTKEVGKGTGLGLATVYGIVKQHRGWITVNSEPGHGTTFQIHLPATAARPAARPETRAVLPLRGGHETVLVVEDEPALRDLVRNILVCSGYRVLEAASGKSALGVWAHHAGEIDLLLTDMVMPDGMNGRELARHLQSERPSLQVLYTSGYGSEIVGVNFVLEEGVNFLPKPYSPRRLAEAVRACLDASAKPPPAPAVGPGPDADGPTPRPGRA